MLDRTSLRKPKVDSGPIAVSALVLLLFAAAWLRGAATSGAFLPSAVPTRSDDRAAERNATCVGCHPKEALEWQGSRHRHAFSNEEFSRALSIEPLTFCRDCHAPESASFRSDEHDSIGVACVTCHLAGEAVLAAPKAFLASGIAPHRLERSAAFSASGACRSCHEFSFGDDARRSAPLLMQSTVSEHAESGDERSCADCHMPSGSHAFASTRDPEAHRAAIRTRVERSGPTAIRVTLETNDVGHAYPTGDLFRRVRVSAEAVVDGARLVALEEAFLQRSFDDGLDARHTIIREQVADTRIHPKTARIVDLDLGPVAIGARIDWRVDFERVLHVRDGHERQATVADSVELAAGVLPAP